MEPSPANPRFPARFKRLYLLMSHAIDETLAPHGLARSQWLVLSHVHRAGTLAQKELQTLMRVESATLTDLVAALVAKGWLERLGNPQDKRGKVLRFTPDGEKRWRTIPDPIDFVEARMLEGLGPKDRALLERSVEKMIENLKGRPKD